MSANWLAEHLGVNPRLRRRLPGVRAASRRGVAGRQRRDRQRRGRLRAGAPGTPQPAGQLPRQPDAGGPRRPSSGRFPRVIFGPLAMIALAYNEYVQRYGATREAMAAVVAEARKNGARIPWSYWSRKAPVGRGVPGGPDDQRSRSAGSTATSRSTGWPPSSSRRPSERATCRTARSTSPGTPPGPRSRHRLPLHWPLDDIMEVGTETAAACGSAPGFGPAEVDLPQVYDGFSPFVYFWMEVARALSGRRGSSAGAREAASTATARGVTGALRRRRAGQRADARGAADARVLPATGRSGRRAPTCQARPSAWPATRRRTSVERSSTARSRFDHARHGRRGDDAGQWQRRARLLCSQMTWAERAADRSPVVQRSRSRGVEQATHDRSGRTNG